MPGREGFRPEQNVHSAAQIFGGHLHGRSSGGEVDANRPGRQASNRVTSISCGGVRF
jgi:hypothetical protein